MNEYDEQNFQVLVMVCTSLKHRVYGWQMNKYDGGLSSCVHEA